MRLFSLLLLVLTWVSTVSSNVETADSANGIEPVNNRRVEVISHASPSRRNSLRTRNVHDRDLIVGGILCRNDVSTRCICELDDLLDAFAKASTNARRVTRIPLCYGSFFNMDKPINITGKAFALKCIRPEQCTFRGKNSNLFVGAPLIARFIFLSFEFGEAERGGAMHLTGGKTRFINMYIDRNEANTTGGAIFVEGNNTEFTYSGTIFTGNYCNGTGGAISVANGATVRSIRSSYLGNVAETLGGAIFNSGGSVSLTISLFSDNDATTGYDLYNTARNGTRIGATKTDCASVIKTTFCDGKQGIVTSGAATSNCPRMGVFGLDPRCFILGLGGNTEDDN